MAEFRRAKAPNASCLILTTEATREQSLNYGCLVVNPTSARVILLPLTSTLPGPSNKG